MFVCRSILITVLETDDRYIPQQNSVRAEDVRNKYLIIVTKRYRHFQRPIDQFNLG